MARSARPRVAHLTTTDISLRYLLLPQLLAVLDAGGEAIGISAPGPYAKELEAQGVRHIPLTASTRSLRPLADLRAAGQLWRVLRKERPDVLHTHNPKPGLYGRVVGRLARVPMVVNTVHGLYATPDDTMVRRLAVYSLEAVASRFSHAELIQSREDFDLLVRSRLYPARRTCLLGNGIDLERFRPDRFPPDVRRRVRTELNVAEDDVLVGMVGRLVREKGYTELFEAAERLRGRVRFVVVGDRDPEKSDALDQTTMARAETAGVRFVGFRTDIDQLYTAMDIFVLPSHREGFPRSAMEASAMGLPVVATDIRGCREVVDDGVTGLLVPVNAPGPLATTLLALAADPERRQRMGAAGRRLALERFDERRVVKEVMDTYRSVDERADEPRRHRLPGPGDCRWPPTTAAPGSGPAGSHVKRAMDVAVSATALVVLSPLLVATWLVVRVANGRPAFFRQERAGLEGRVFQICKFRTMTDDRDSDGELLADSQRLTRLGRKLRSTSLDELPELVNILLGDMSLVGPRPLPVRYLDRYTLDQARRHETRPGLTGLAQISGRNAIGWEERLALDVKYIDCWSLRLDLDVLRRTVSLVLARRGISGDDHATMREFTGTADRD
jgi:lipopolysaccharide/colanic/teichoic acid biosynthesis glycosyltransferase/glycosyltransferase involved in cell wall biosynthesis